MKRQEIPTLRRTINYSMFEQHEYNRDIGNITVLEESMRKYGFDPGFPIRCTNGHRGKLKINQGHHRFYIAKKLKIPVYYVVSENALSLFDVERGNRQWTLTDFLSARAKAGEEGPVRVQKYIKDTGISAGQAISVMGGQLATSHNKYKQIINGTYKTGDLEHSKKLGSLVLYLSDLGIPFSRQAPFVGALSKCLMCTCFDEQKFRHKARTHLTMFDKARSLDDYLYLIENIYNQQTPVNKKIPLAFEAKREAQARSACKPKNGNGG